MILPALGMAVAIRRKADPARLLPALRTVMAYYLALQLLHYGFSKVFKWQFYLPEPNTLYTPFGELPPDLAYWSLLGLHRPYVVGAGVVELLAAFLLLLRPTRYLGAMLSAVILVHVLALNLTFHLTVGAYSAWLLTLALYIAHPALGATLRTVTGRSTAPLTLPSWHLPSRAAYVGLKTLVLGTMLVDSLFLYLDTGNFNDDLAPRPPLHGAYALADAAPVDTLFRATTQRFFVHRHGYGITQSPQGFASYPLRYLDAQHIALITPADTLRYRHRQHGDTLWLYPLHQPDTLTLVALPWRTLPALR